MPILMVANNLVVFLGTYMACGFSFCIMLLGYVLMVVASKFNFQKFIRVDKRFHDFEKSWYFGVAWGGSAFMTALMFSLVFEEVYNSVNIIDTSTIVLALYPVYQLFMFLWLFTLHVWFKHPKLSFLFVTLAMFVAVINTVLIFLFPVHNWTHYLNILLFVPTVFAIFATNSSITFRNDIVSTIVQLVTTKSTKSGKHNALRLPSSGGRSGNGMFDQRV